MHTKWYINLDPVISWSVRHLRTIQPGNHRPDGRVRMNMATTRAWTVLVASGLLSGCGGNGPDTIAERVYQGLPDGVTPATLHGNESSIAIIEHDHRLALTLWGSGSCPRLPVSLHALNRHSIEITVDKKTSGVCTADLGPTTSVIKLDPEEIDTASEVAITLHDSWDPNLPATEITARPRQP